MPPSPSERLNGYRIRKAAAPDALPLTQVAKSAKRYWNYPDSYYKIWEEELTITPDYISKNTVFVAQTNSNEVIAFYSLVTLEQDLHFKTTVLEKGVWLDHMFIIPEYIGQGLGHLMFNHMMQGCRVKNITMVRLLADPNAKGFYEKMGCQYVRQVPSSIEGRTTPMYEIIICGAEES